MLEIYCFKKNLKKDTIVIEIFDISHNRDF